MVRHGGALWERHPHVANDLSFGERASDKLKLLMGTWSLLGLVAMSIVFWLLLVSDPGELHLNLALSCMAAVQGIVLQIAANRGDRISAEVALHTQANTDELMTINRQQLAILNEVRQLRAELADGSGADVPVRPGAGGNPAEAGFPADGHAVPPGAPEPAVGSGGAP
jgi:uncharacterized membrane protein